MAQSDRKDTGMQEALGVEAQKDMLSKPCTLCSIHLLHQKHVKSQAQTRGESQVTGAGFYNKLVWILAHSRKSPKARLRPELEKVVTLGKEKV